jgi:hypothetical protein
MLCTTISFSRGDACVTGVSPYFLLPDFHEWAPTAPNSVVSEDLVLVSTKIVAKELECVVQGS